MRAVLTEVDVKKKMALVKFEPKDREAIFTTFPLECMHNLSAHFQDVSDFSVMLGKSFDVSSIDIAAAPDVKDEARPDREVNITMGGDGSWARRPSKIVELLSPAGTKKSPR